MTTSLSLIQRQVIESPLDIRLFVSGRAGTGKTTVGVERMRYLLAQGIPAGYHPHAHPTADDARAISRPAV